MSFFIGGYIYDAILLVLCGIAFKTFILRKDLSGKESFFLQHTPSVIYIPLALILIASMVCTVLIDRGLLSLEYKFMALFCSFVIWGIIMITGLYHRIRYEEKEYNRLNQETKQGIASLIGLLLLGIFMWLFAG